MENNDKTRVSVAEMRRHQPRDLITFRVSALAQLLANVVDVSVNTGLGLTSRQWRLLVMLNALGEATSGAVSRISRLDHSQVSRASYELAGKGLISMSGDRADRRRQLLRITQEGTDILRRGLVGSLARQRRLRSRLSDADYETFGRVMAVLSEEAQAMLDELKSTPAR